MTNVTPTRVAIIGTARRSDYLHGPIVQALPEEVELVAVWGRSEDSARPWANSLGVPWYTDLDKLMQRDCARDRHRLRNYSANGQVGLMAVEADCTCCSRRLSPTI